MNWRWMVSEDGGVTFPKQVKPVGVTNPLVDWTVERSTERAGKRLKLSSALTFTDADYRYLKALKNSEGFCGPVFIRLELKCSGWKVLWTGRFPLGGGVWNYRKCTFVIKPDTEDKLTCILQKQDVKQNILRVGPVTANVVVIPSLEFIVCEWSGGAPICAIPTGYTAAHVWTPIPPIQIVVLWREFAVTECVDDAPVEPPGTGWTLLEDNCATDGTAKYVRTPEDPWSFGDPEFFLDGDGYPEPPPSTCGTWKELGTYEYPTDPPGEVPFYVCLSNADPVSLTRARTLRSVLEFFLSKMDCDIEGIRSDFFGINPVGDAPGYVEGENYVKPGEPTQTEAICIVHKTDVIDPGATQPATKGDMSFKDLMAALNVMYKVRWTIDADGYLRIEHYKFWNTGVVLDLTVVPQTSLVESWIHETLNNEIPNVERMLFAEALGRDFVGADIIYSGPCVTEVGDDSEIEYNVKDITTDIGMILGDPTSVSRKGFVFLACTFNGTDYETIIDEGAITGEFYSNAPMSAANLMRDYWTWDRYLPSGNMNGQDMDFDGSRPTIQQPQITLKCFDCQALDFTGDGMVISTLGEGPLGGVLGMLDRAELDTEGNLRLSLRYSV